ncbi:O-antigen polymerase [Slackia heliotrinireducens]|uniref:O-antigen polymerase n=1 Tax=Slackia heliotrinireducens TaxID=84110 RepID=UPI00331635DC
MFTARPMVNAECQRGLFPSILIIALVSHFVYYYGVINGTYSQVQWLLAIAVGSLLVGYFFGSVIVPSKERIRNKRRQLVDRIDGKRMKLISLVFFLVGLLVHIYFYSSHSFTNYAESYDASQGFGYITVFFNFIPLSLILNEFLISRDLMSKKWTVASRIVLMAFCVFYFLALMKRRQVLFLLLAIMAIWGPRLKPMTKGLIYLIGIGLLILFSVFGRVRGYYDANGIIPTVYFVLANFNPEWLAIDSTEGKYISIILNDVNGYVNSYGYNPGILLGVAFCLIPRALLGASKPMSFPTWYVATFHPDLYGTGVGFAGSMIAELYLIGGIEFLLLGYVAIGFICARMQRRGTLKGDPVGNIVYAIFIYTIVLLPRYDLASLVIDIAFIYLPLIWAMKTCTLKQGRAYSVNAKQNGNAVVAVKRDISPDDVIKSAARENQVWQE